MEKRRIRILDAAFLSCGVAILLFDTAPVLVESPPFRKVRAYGGRSGVVIPVPLPSRAAPATKAAGSGGVPRASGETPQLRNGKVGSDRRRAHRDANPPHAMRPDRLEKLQQKWEPILRPELRKNKEIEHVDEPRFAGHALRLGTRPRDGTEGRRHEAGSSGTRRKRGSAG